MQARNNHGPKKINARSRALFAILILFTAWPLLAQITPAKQLTEAFALVKEGKPAPAVVELRGLLDSNSLDADGSGKAWNILGLAYEDMGEFNLSQHAYEESLRILESLPDNLKDYAMALDDFGALYVATGQFELAEKLRTKALGLYEKTRRPCGHCSVIRRSCRDRVQPEESRQGQQIP